MIKFFDIECEWDKFTRWQKKLLKYEIKAWNTFNSVL